MKQFHKDYLILNFIIVLWSFTAIIGELITLPAIEVVLFRTFIASFVLFFLLKFRKIPLKLERDFWEVLGVGGLIAIHWILFFVSARIENVSVCLAGMATCPLWTSIIEPLYNKRKVKSFEVVLGFFAFVGIGIILFTQINNPLGLILAFLSALFAALFTVINGKLITRHNAFTLTFYEMCGAFIITILILPAYSFVFSTEIYMNPTVQDIALLLILAVVCTVYAFSVSIELMKRLSVFAINLTVNLEPVYGIILALIIFKESEKMDWRFYLGTSIILLSVILYPVLNSFYKRKALSTDIIR